MVLQKGKSLDFRSPEIEVGTPVFVSALMYMDCMHAVTLKPASVHFTFISEYDYHIYFFKE